MTHRSYRRLSTGEWWRRDKLHVLAAAAIVLVIVASVIRISVAGAEAERLAEKHFSFREASTSDFSGMCSPLRLKFTVGGLGYEKEQKSMDLCVGVF